jgi:hypothetical protein
VRTVRRLQDALHTESPSGRDFATIDEYWDMKRNAVSACIPEAIPAVVAANERRN